MYHVLPEGLHGSWIDAAVEESILVVEQSTLIVEPSVQFATSRCLAHLMQELGSFQLVGGIRMQVLTVSEFFAGPSAVVNKFLMLELQLIVVLGQLLVRRLQTCQLQYQQQALLALLGTQVRDQM